MRSRNATVRKLREKERGLELALERLSELAQDLQRKNEQLESARRGMAAQDRLATIGLLSASVAHELNTPLSVLRGSIEQLQESVEEPQARERLARIRRVTDRLGRISESLLDFSRSRRARPQRARFDCARWSMKPGRCWPSTSEPRPSLFATRFRADWSAPGDEDRLMQVFVNLLKNGVFALDQGGGITVRARRDNDAAGDWIAVDVDDDGPGIPEDVLPSIFEAFVSSRLDSRGTGLGLTVADGIVQQHGGQLIAANRDEGGARLTVRCRCCHGSEEGSDRMSAVNESAPAACRSSTSPCSTTTRISCPTSRISWSKRAATRCARLRTRTTCTRPPRSDVPTSCCST
jgi:signal transduction histidine kinase